MIKTLTADGLRAVVQGMVTDALAPMLKQNIELTAEIDRVRAEMADMRKEFAQSQANAERYQKRSTSVTDRVLARMVELENRVGK